MQNDSQWIATSAGFIVACLLTIAYSSPLLAQENLPFKFTGAGACSASKCHGGMEASTSGSFQGNENTVWANEDEYHPIAYSVLENDESKEIASELGEGDPTKSDKCLSCHTTGDAARFGFAGVAYNDKNLQGVKYNVEDGVSCDSCHGPAGKWLESHTEKGWVDKQRALFSDPVKMFSSIGIYDTKRVMLRANNCVACHLRIDSEMLEAGHPDLSFELSTYSKTMPPHWRPEGDYFTTKAWIAGQVATLREAFYQLSDCCEKKAEDYIEASREKIGGHAMVLRHALNAEQAKALDSWLKSIDDAGEDFSKIGSISKTAAQKTNAWGPGVDSMEPNKEQTLKLLTSVLEATSIADSGDTAMEQTILAAEALYSSYVDAGGEETEDFDTSIEEYYEALDSEEFDDEAKKALTSTLKKMSDLANKFE